MHTTCVHSHKLYSYFRLLYIFVILVNLFRDVAWILKGGSHWVEKGVVSLESSGAID